MGLFEGKSPAERNKIIAVIVLGTLAIISLTYTFGGALFSGSRRTASTTTEASPSPTESPAASDTSDTVRSLPEQNAIDNEYASIPISFVGSNAGSVPMTGRNIFAFWEPGDPTPVPYVPPTPIPVQTFTPVPPPDYKIFLSFVTPQSVYAGSKQFRLEVNGDKFKPDSRIIFNGAPLQTTFISEQRLFAEIPAALISRAFTGSIMVDSPSTSFFSRQIAFDVQAPPTPQFEYIGMIARRHYNNDTAYFQKKGSTSGDPFSARLNDIVEGRFRVISISSREVEFQDTRLGFKHKLPLLRPEPGVSLSDSSGFDGDDGDGTDFDSPPPVPIPGIPSNIRRTPIQPGSRVNPTLPQKPDEPVKEDQDN